MSARVFPLELFPADSFQIFPAATASSGGAALNGPGQRVDWSGGGWWVGALGGVVLWQPDQIRAWRALAMHARNGGEIIMPVIDWAQRPFPEGLTDLPPVPHADGAPFHDGALYASRVLNYELAEAVQEGDMTALVRRVLGAPLRGGEFFTPVHEASGPRLHCIEAVSEETAGVSEVLFGCPWREDSAAGAFLDFERPRLTMEILSAPQELWPRIEAPFEATVGFTFSESFDYL